MQWVDGLDKTVSDGVSNEDLGAKPGGDELVVKRRAPQLDVQELELEQQPGPQDILQETKEASSSPELETQDIISEHKQDEVGPAAGSTNLKVPVVPVLRKLTISVNLPRILSSRTSSRRVHAGAGGAALQNFLPTIKEVTAEGNEESVSMYDGGGPMALQMKVDIPEPIVGDMLSKPKNRQ